MQFSAYQMFKYVVVWATGLAMDALHIYVGLAVLFGAAALLRRPLGSWLPWLAVVLAACAGEVLDVRDDMRVLGYWQWQASVHDIWNTLFWPTTLVIMARTGVLSRLIAGARRPRADARGAVTAEPRETPEG